MSVLLLVPPKIVLQTSADDWRSVVGKNAVLFTDKSAANVVTSHVGDVFAKIEYFENFNDNDLVEKRALDLNNDYKFFNIVAFAEIDVLRAARLRKYLNLPGATVEDATYFRDKYKMKQLARSKGVPVADFMLIHNAIEYIDFIKQQQYPVVIKPIDGRGSAGVHIIENNEQLVNYFDSGDLSRSGPRLAEKFIAGDMYQANGLYINGKCVLISVVKCVNSCLEFLHGEFLGLCMLSDENLMKQRVVNFTRDLLEKVLPMPQNGLFHVELFHDDNDQILLCEAACRLGGCIVNDEIRAASGVDARLEYARTQCIDGYLSPLVDSPMSTMRLIGQLNIPPKSGVLQHIPDSCPYEWVEFYKLNGVVGKRYDKMAFTNSEIVSFLANGTSENEIQQRFYELSDWFERNTIWKSA